MITLGILILALVAGIFGFMVVGPLGPVLYFMAFVLFVVSAVMYMGRKRRRGPPPRS